MNKILTAMLCLVLSITYVIGSAIAGDAEVYWPGWRGPASSGVAPNADPPIEWSEEKNIKWKIEIPGSGHASPIVWDDRIFVLTAVETAGQPEKAEEAESSDDSNRRGRRTQASRILAFKVLAISREDGKILWEKTACQELPHEGIHRTSSWASCSPVTDGKSVFAWFGSQGLYCFDFDGNLRWGKDFGKMTVKNAFGEGTAPALFENTIVTVWDHEGDSFIVALNATTGDEIWRKDRDEMTSWASPLIVDVEGVKQVVVNGSNRIRSYDLTSGKVLWECGGMTKNTIPTPVEANGLVYVMSGFRGAALRAIKLSEAKGDITDSSAIVWARDEDTPYVPSPVLFGDLLYFLKGRDAMLSCCNAKTGEEYFAQQRLDGLGDVYASLVGAKDHVYVVGRDGTTIVVKRGPEFKIVATNTLDDSFSASPAIVGKELYLRGENALYCIAEN